MVFFLAFPSVSFFGNSIYFYVFLLMLIRTKKITGRFILKDKYNTILFFLFLSGLISSTFHPHLKFDPGLSSKLNMILHFGYWFLISAYFKSWFQYINIYRLAKWITVGFILQILGFYFIQLRIGLVLINIDFSLSRNALVFNSIIFSGFVFYYMHTRYKSVGLIVSTLFIFTSLLLTNGRAGAIIGFLITLLAFSVYFPTFRNFGRVALIVLVLIASIAGLSQQTQIDTQKKLAVFVEAYNPRFASLLKNEGYGDLSFDKSWLIRKLMIDKAIEIYNEYPFFGVGWGNFTRYASELSSLSSYPRLLFEGEDYFNTRSAHNSYAQYLSEGGIVGFGILLLLVLPIFIWILISFLSGSFKPFFVISLSLFGASLHLYAISSLTGANFWFLLGIVSGLKSMSSPRKQMK